MTRDATRPVLVSDVGGTNTRIALVDGDGRQMAVRRYANDSFSSYYDALSRFLVEHPETTGLAGACVAVALARCAAGGVWLPGGLCSDGAEEA